jgi:uncharacterized membrane protein YbhN (UPF0104 family)
VKATIPDAPAAYVAAAPRKNGYFGFALRAGLGLAIVGVLLWRYDARPILRILAREHPAYFIAAIAIYVAGQVMSSWRWQLLAAVVGVRARWRDFLSYYFVGMFTNLFVPGLVGGDAARAVYLSRHSHRLAASIASVAADRGVGLIALFWLAAVMAIAFPSGLTPGIIRIVVLAGVLAMIGFIGAPLIARSIAYFPRRLRRPLEIATPYMKRPQSTIPAAMLSVILQFSLGLCQWLLARGLGMSTPLRVFLLCVPITNVIAGMPVTLNGLGLRESAYLVLLGMAGVARDDAIALGLLWFAATIFGGLTGAIAFVLTELPSTGTGDAAQLGRRAMRP